MACQGPGQSQQQDKNCKESYIVSLQVSHTTPVLHSVHSKSFLMFRKLFSRKSCLNSLQCMHKDMHAYARGWIKAECWIQVFITNVCMCTHTYIYAGCIGMSYLFCYAFAWESSLQLVLHPFSSTTCHIHSQNWSTLETTSLTFLNLLV